ncbi:MAG: hypothetical protein FWC22_00260 [Treponema sp.]|nr:hypothetical protein [Treponema sp.]
MNIFNGSEKILKYPVVLVHGIFAHDRKAVINFWGRIPDVFRENGIDVFLGNTDAWGGYDTNAGILKNTVDDVFNKTNSDKINIIAHSKGGIDSRYLIWKYGYGDKVASLTTISTPHHGAELADLIFMQKIVHTRASKKALHIFGRLYGDTNPNLYNLNHQLTTEKMEEFNKKVIMDERVYYQSIYTTMHNALDDLMFFFSYKYIKSISGANDGVVSEKSAKWSGNITHIEGISHAEIVDYKMQDISGSYIPGIYLNIVKDLGSRGF